MFYPELGYISLDELNNVRGYLGLPIEQDKYFEAKFPLSVYAEAARKMCKITENMELLKQVATNKSFHQPRP